MPSFEVKKAERSDLETLYQLVKELTTYERNDPNKVSTENLERFGFGQNPIFQSYLCQLENESIGYSIHYYKFSAFCTTPVLFLEDLYVKPEFRSQGAATALMLNLKEVAKESGCSHMEWYAYKWNELANNFYSKIANKRAFKDQYYEWEFKL